MKLSWNHLGIRSKIILLGISLISTMSLTIFFYFIPQMEKSNIERKKEVVRDVTKSVHGIMEYYHSEQEKGNITENEAKARVIEIVREIRFGIENKDYLWINDFHPTMIMHPYATKLNGKDISKETDEDGVFIFNQMVDKCQGPERSGYVRYKWQHYDQSGDILPKISFVMAFMPWGWIIGSGIYIDDVQEEIWEIIWYIVAITLLIMVGSSIVLFIFSRSISHPIREVVDLAAEVSNGNLNRYIPQRHYVKCVDEFKCTKTDCPAYYTKNRACWRIPNTINADGSLMGEVEEKMAQCKGCVVYKKSIRNEIDRLVESINNMVVSNAGIFRNLQEMVTSIDVSVLELKKSIDEEAAAIHEQMTSVEETHTTMEELNTIAQGIEEDSRKVFDSMTSNIEFSRNSKKDLLGFFDLIKTIGDKNEVNMNDITELNEKSNQINEVMSTIDDIANQTKLIAFNATIEAAGSGDLGKRFGIVAEEIRRLAGSVMEATDEITQEIRSIQTVIKRILLSSKEETAVIKEGVENSERTGSAMESILKMSEDSHGRIENIATAISQQKEATEQVLYAVRDISNGSAVINDNINYIVGFIEAFSELSTNLKDIIARFHFSQE